MSGVAGPRNCLEEEGKGKGHKFLWLFCDLVRGAFCRPCDTRQIQLLGQNSYSLLEGCSLYSCSYSFLGFQRWSSKTELGVTWATTHMPKT